MTSPLLSSYRGVLTAALLLQLAACGAASTGAGPAGEGGEGGDPGESGGSSGAGSGGKGGNAGSGGAAEPTEQPDAASMPDSAAVPETPDAGAPDGASASPDGGGSNPTASLVPSPACAGGAMMPGPAGNQTIMANGKNRTFIIRMPTAGYDGKKPFPILFAFHGAGGGAASFESGAFSGVSKMAADRAIRIFPQAYGGNTWSRDENDDVKFMDSLIDWLKTRVCYDTARVFASGHSSGAYFSHRFACDRGTVIRAVATNSGGQRMERALECENPISAWMSTGRADNPGHVMGTRQARDVWGKLAGCAMTSAPTPPSPCVALTGCRAGFAVNYCEHPGGHPMPSFAAGGMVNFLLGGGYLGAK
jgi:polyhydroxybutyrate depolymerase